MSAAGNYRTRIWRAGIWWRATVHGDQGLVLDLHLLDSCAEDPRGALSDDVFAAQARDQRLRVAGVLQPPVKLGARA